MARAGLYLLNAGAARQTIKALSGVMQKTPPIVEINPGSGVLTRQLLKLRPRRLLLFEQSHDYTDALNQLKADYPNILDYQIANFLKIPKLAFQDSLDSGSRIDEIFKHIKSIPWGKEICMNVIGAIPSLDFIRHLISSVIFQNTLATAGRSEFYLTMFPADYYNIQGKGGIDIGVDLKYYKALPVLFNLLFDHKLIVKLPRSGFGPIKTKTYKVNYKNKLQEIDKEYLYLVKISPKEKLPCKVENLPLMWYFFKQNLINKHNRIIPTLEQWIPGCGVWLITNQDPPGTNVDYSPDEDDAELPHITIFTLFSDLCPRQNLTVFKKFISWPEFEQSPFREISENYIYKIYSNISNDQKEEIVDAETEEIQRSEM